METEKISDNIFITEVVSQDVYNKFGINAVWFLDHRIINVVEWLRVYFNKPVILNNWYNGGKIEHAGYRTPDCRIGAKFSQHKFGRALDFNIQDFQPEVIRNFIRKQFPMLRNLGLSAMEKDTPSWVHIDCRYTGLKYLLEFNHK